jgi:uncharacterized membrane protein
MRFEHAARTDGFGAGVPGNNPGRHSFAANEEGGNPVNVCEEIRQTIDVDAPAAVANAEWTRFTFWNLYYRNLEGPDPSEAESDSGFVRLEAVGDHAARVTVDLNYCPHFAGISDPEEIAKVQQHLHDTLRRYKRFIESQHA